MWGYLWCIAIVWTMVLVKRKNLNAMGFFFLALFTGVLAVIIAYIVDDEKDKQADVAMVSNTRMLRVELDALKRMMTSLQTRMTTLENLLIQKEQLEEEGKQAPELISPAIKEVKAPATVSQVEVEGDLESRFGRFWLNKIGMVVFTLGVGFLISYSFQYFGALTKILVGYVISAGLFFAGNKYHKQEQYRNFSIALLGGGWALVYFTTFAMHHFEASRIIHSQFVDLILLFFVAIGMIKHALKYQSEKMTAVALFIAYLTSTLSNVSQFTFMSCLIISVMALVLVYKFQWIKTLFLGVFAAYATHFFWVSAHIGISPARVFPFLCYSRMDVDLISITFLCLYWLLFMGGVHLFKNASDKDVSRQLAIVNFGNFIFFTILAYPIILSQFQAQKFLIVFGVGCLYALMAGFAYRLKKQEVFKSDVVLSVLALTLCVPLKFSNTGTLLLWLVEIPFLVYAGCKFKEPIYRGCAYVLTVLGALKFMIGLESFYSKGPLVVSFAGLSFHWVDFVCFMSSIFLSAAFIVSQIYLKGDEEHSIDGIFNQVFSLLAVSGFTMFLALQLKGTAFEVALMLEAFLLVLAGYFSSRQRFCIYGYGLLAFGLMMFFVEPHYHLGNWHRGLLVAFEIAIFYILYYQMKYKIFKPFLLQCYEREASLLFIGGTMLLVGAHFFYVQESWLSVLLGISSVVYICCGLGLRDKTIRIGGIVILGVTLFRVVFVDIAQLEIIYKIICFIVLGVLFLGVSFVYNKIDIKK